MADACNSAERRWLGQVSSHDMRGWDTPSMLQAIRRHHYDRCQPHQHHEC
jgi:hypothetical protein